MRLDFLKAPELGTIAIIGAAKNAGKTTTLNAVIEAVREMGRLGVLSIGIDGETVDFWLGIPKPKVAIPKDTLVATTDEIASRSGGSLEILEETGIRTPIGMLCLCVAERDTHVLLAGIRHRADVIDMLCRMRRNGAKRLFVDGSYQRTMAASRDVSDGVILATGAIAGPSIEDVVRNTRKILQRFQMKKSSEFGDTQLFDLTKQTSIAYARWDGGPTMAIESEGWQKTVDKLIEMDSVGGNSADLVIATPGTVTDGPLVKLAASRLGAIRILVTDATRVFLDLPMSALPRKVSLAVQAEIRVLAVTVNPTSVAGPDLPGPALIAALTKEITDIPVINVLDEN